MNRPNRNAVLLVAVLFAFASAQHVAGEDKFTGDVTVAGTLSARSMRVANDTVATEKSLETLHKAILSEVVAEISKKLRLNSSSVEMREFVAQIAKSVVATVGNSSKLVQDLRREFDASTKSAASQVTELKRTITVMQDESKIAQRELAALKQEMEELKREVAKKRSGLVGQPAECDVGFNWLTFRSMRCHPNCVKNWVWRIFMICDAVREDEIFEAYLLYASLHGMSTDPQQARERIASYLNNVPDTTLDLAILAFAEDRILAPPDVVLDSWGKSRVYTLYQTPQLEWRHRVCPRWFDNGCIFLGDSCDPDLCHFWTQFPLTVERSVLSHDLCSGMRVRLVLEGEQIRVMHRCIGEIGSLPQILVQEFAQWDGNQVKTLSLIDRISQEGESQTCTLLVTRASSSISSAQIVDYTSSAFQAARAEC